jgi:predicted MFS family arabinose efflux permease
MLVDSTAPANRAKTQGSIDVMISLGGATGGGMSGLVMAGTSYAILSLTGGLLSLLLLGVLWRHAAAPQRNETVLERLESS